MTLPKTPSMNLSGKRALVTGASSGIGQGCAVALAEAGAHVVCSARGVERLQSTVDAMATEGWSAEALALDVSDLPALEAALAAQVPFDIIVNAAGYAKHGPATDTRPEDFDAVMNINLRGAYFLSAWAAKSMQDAGDFDFCYPRRLDTDSMASQTKLRLGKPHYPASIHPGRFPGGLGTVSASCRFFRVVDLRRGLPYCADP